jgi:SAM-dependent methyltransferase
MTATLTAMTTPPPASFADPAGTWNSRFAEAGYLFGTAPNEWLRENAGVWKAGDRLLCVADGEGRNSVWLAGLGLMVDAFDISDVGVEKARRLATEQGVSVNFTVADCDGYAWPEAAFDGVAAIFVQFADPALRERLFVRMVQSLKPGGTLVLQGYTTRQLEFRTGGPPLASHLYTEAMLRVAFSDLEILSLRDYEADVAEGAGHHGHSALIGLLARRR